MDQRDSANRHHDCLCILIAKDSHGLHGFTLGSVNAFLISWLFGGIAGFAFYVKALTYMDVHGLPRRWE